MTDQEPNDRVMAVSALRGALDERFAARDRAGAVRIASEAVRTGQLGVETLYTQVLVPLLVETGAQWQRGAERVWEEHFATATVRTIVEGLYPDVVAEAEKRPRLGKTAVLACPPGEQHDLGLRMLSDRLHLAGWNVYFLGADTPVAEIAAAAQTLDADVIALTAATHYSRLLLRETIDELKRLAPGVRVGVGGPAFAADPTWSRDDVLTEADLGLPSMPEGEG